MRLEGYRIMVMAAEQGYADAQFAFGLLRTFLGNGVIGKDHREAVRWYRMAAEQGNARAQFNLGISYVR